MFGRKAAAARAKAQSHGKDGPAVTSTGQGSAGQGSAEELMMEFHKELMEMCVDALARYTFSTSSKMPKRFVFLSCTFQAFSLSCSPPLIYICCNMQKKIKTLHNFLMSGHTDFSKTL